MGCEVTATTEEPLLASLLKGYNQSELTNLVSYLDQTLAWLESKHNSTPLAILNTSTCMFRVGIPYVGSDSTVTADTVYTANEDEDNLIRSIGVDALKFSFNSGNTYTYKASYIHRIFSNYFVNGVDNKTGLSYLNDYNISLSTVATIPIGQPLKTPQPVPSYVVHAFTYISQNPKMLVAVEGSERTKGGDVVYLRVSALIARFTEVRDKAATKRDNLATFNSEQNQDLYKILETTGLLESFDSLNYGGVLSTLQIQIRIPASRDNQETLEGLLDADSGSMSNVFKETYVGISDVDLAKHPKKDDLEDVYSTSMGADELGNPYNLDNEYNGYYGCKKTEIIEEDNEEDDDDNGGTTTTTVVTYRHWQVDNAWFQSLTAEKKAIIFWMGLDLNIGQDNPCPYDEVITIIIIIAMTIYGVQGASTLVQGLLITAAVISIAITTGQITGKRARNAAILAAILTITASGINYSEGMATGFQFSMQIASTSLQVKQVWDQYQFETDMARKESELKDLTEDAEMYESQLRFIYGESFEVGPNSLKQDPFKYIDDMYKDFRMYD